MAKEIERKFLVSDDSWRNSASSPSRFLQAYVATADDRSVRVRIVDGARARLTIKIGKGFVARDEFEYDIPLDDAQELANCATGIVLEKTRYRIAHEGYTWEVDVFGGIYQGLVVAEVEMGSETEKPTIPEWVGQEITGDRRYSNAIMATEDLSKELVDALPPAAR